MSEFSSLFRSVIRTFFSIRSILYLFFRLFPIVFGIIYYQQLMDQNVLMNLANYLQKTRYFSFLVNQIIFFNNYYSDSICKNLSETNSQINTDVYDLVWFVVIWHYTFQLIHILSSKVKKKNLRLNGLHQFGLLGLILILILYSINFSLNRTGHVTNQPLTMFFITILYFLINTASSLTVSLFEFAIFFSQGLIMTQFISDNVADQLNFELFMLYLPILLVVEALFLSIQLKDFKEDGEQTFSRVIGMHDSILLYIVFFGVIYFMNVLDMLYREYLLGIPLFTIPYAFWLITKALASENKTLPANTAVILLIYSFLYLFSLVLVCNHKNDNISTIQPPKFQQQVKKVVQDTIASDLHNVIIDV